MIDDGEPGGPPAISRRAFVTGAAATGLLLASRRPGLAADTFDVVVYGGSSAGVIAAYAAARENLRVALVIGPNPIGGMTANGLSKSDLSEENYVGGLTRSFFVALGRYYRIGGLAHHFEPHVAEALFRRLLAEIDCRVYQKDIAETGGVLKQDNRITAIRLTDGTVIGGRAFIDASYEGDLMAQAGVAYDIGREARSRYGESVAGFGAGLVQRSYRARNAQGQLLPGVRPWPDLAIGARDLGVMAYNYRLSLTNDPYDRVPFRRPPDYDPDAYLLMLQQPPHGFHPGGALSVYPSKFDRNDDREPGFNWAFPNGSRAVRAAIVQRQIRYQAGRLYFLANDRRLPARVRDEANQYGLCMSEFPDNKSWPRQLYIREARRMRGMYKMRQQHAETPVRFPDSALKYIYTTDSHVVQILEGPDGRVVEEGSLSNVRPKVKPWWVPLRALLPHEQHCDNLVVPVCASNSRIFNTAYRMEPAYMMAGEAAAVLAATAIRENAPLQQLDLPAVSRKLVDLGARF